MCKEKSQLLLMSQRDIYCSESAELTPSGQTTYCRIRYPFATVPRHTLMSGTMLYYLIPSIIEQIFSREVFQWASQWRSALVGGCCVSAWCGWVRTIGIDWRHNIYCFTWILSEVGDLCKTSQEAARRMEMFVSVMSTLTSKSWHHSSMNLHHKFETDWKNIIFEIRNSKFLGLNAVCGVVCGKTIFFCEMILNTKYGYFLKRIRSL